MRPTAPLRDENCAGEEGGREGYAALSRARARNDVRERRLLFVAGPAALAARLPQNITLSCVSKLALLSRNLVRFL